ncbi:MAG: hypothetical protein VB128_03505 [Sedimentibacter saalensis]|uniref:hypothetical protein n=1 Tax=Sedimentibacter saalensis TaxID=130788 RepID=UPI002B1F26DC|nr:hypothetical protein [Sedimentibacter saalensis]MEA5094002.1 hypothetical protein [Sedimentibacter saalensis]
MKSKLLIIFISIFVSVTLLTVGYGFWVKDLHIIGSINVVPDPEKLEAMKMQLEELESELELQKSFEEQQRILEEQKLLEEQKVIEEQMILNQNQGAVTEPETNNTIIDNSNSETIDSGNESEEKDIETEKSSAEPQESSIEPGSTANNN